MKLQCGILFVLLNVAVALAQTGCKNARIDLAVVIDSTMKDGIREPVRKLLMPIMAEIGVVNRVALITYDSMVHPFAAPNAGTSVTDGLREIAKKTPDHVKKQIPILNRWMDTYDPDFTGNGQTPIDMLDTILESTKESPTPVNIGQALQAAGNMIQNAQPNAAEIRKVVLLLASKPSADSAVSASIELKSSNIRIITVSLDEAATAAVSQLASSPNAAFVIGTENSTDTQVAAILKEICNGASVSNVEVPRFKAASSDRYAARDMFAASGCPAGYTGMYCQIPVCPVKGTAKPYQPSKFGYALDLSILATCNGQSVLPVDTHIKQNLTVLLVTSIGGVPVLNLYKPNGQRLMENETVVVFNNTEFISLVVLKPVLGLWKVTFSSKTPALCIFEAYAPTNLYVDAGFVPVSAQNNAPLNDNPNNLINSGSANFFITHPQGLPCPGKITMLQIFENNAMIWAGPSQTRYNCAYEDYFGWIYCNTASAYYYKISGIDEAGYMWKRTDTMTCVNPPPCMHGGIFVNGSCVCVSTYSGPRCATPVCSNGGTPNGNICTCLPGWSGPFCRFDLCTKTNNNVMNGPNSRSLSFVIQTTLTMYFDIQQIQNTISSLLTQINQQTLNTPSHWFTKYILVTFDENSAQLFVTTSSQALFQAAVGLLKTSQAAPSGVYTYAAIKLALANALPYSPVYIFSDTEPSDYRYDYQIFPLLDTTKNSLNFIFTQLYPAGSPFGSSYGTQSIQYTSAMSDGQLFVDIKPSVASLLEIIPTHYSSGLVFEQTFADCTQGQTVYFPIDSKTTGFTFYSAGEQPNAMLYNENNQLYNPYPMVNSTFIQVLHVYRRKGIGQRNLTPGTWKAVIKTTPLTPDGETYCKFQVRAQSPIQVYYGFTQDPHNDFPTPEPVDNPGYSNMMVAHVSNLTSQGTLEYANLVLWEYYFNQTIIGSTMFNNRINCGFEWYSQPFQCPRLYFGIVVTGYDGQGYVYQRLRVATCLPSSGGKPNYQLLSSGGDKKKIN